jgi:sugar/nucleoside kinase (ribokinase family)
VSLLPSSEAFNLSAQSWLLSSDKCVSFDIQFLQTTHRQGVRVIAKGIAVIGSTTIDKIVLRDRSWFKIGGATTYAGITYSRHGIRTLAVTNIAKRDPEIVKKLRNEKIRVYSEPTEETTHFINYLKDDNRRQKIIQRAAPISCRQLLDKLKGVALVHLGPLHPTDIDIRAIKSLNRRHPYVILDTQGFVRTVKNEIVYPAVSTRLADALRISNLVKANNHEYKAIVDFYQVDLSELMRRFKISEFIVTSGKKGGFIKTIFGETVQYKGYKANKAAAAMSIEDVTGAGDIFLAAYVIGRILNRQMIADASQYAAKLVARQIDGNYIEPEVLALEDRMR